MNTKWNEFTISAIGDVIGGGTPSTKHDEYYNGYCPKFCETHL